VNSLLLREQVLDARKDGIDRRMGRHFPGTATASGASVAHLLQRLSTREVLVALEVCLVHTGWARHEDALDSLPTDAAIGAEPLRRYQRIFTRVLFTSQDLWVLEESITFLSNLTQLLCVRVDGWVLGGLIESRIPQNPQELCVRIFVKGSGHSPINLMGDLDLTGDEVDVVLRWSRER